MPVSPEVIEADWPALPGVRAFSTTRALGDAKGEGDGKTNRMSPHMARVASRYRRVAI